MYTLPEQFDIATRLATHAHLGQYDKGGHAYINHPIRVSNCCASYEAKIVAMLHDVIEDTPITIDRICGRLGYQKSNQIVVALQLLTHDKSDTYFEYITNISMNELATYVKLRDLEDNMDITRLKELTDKDIKRLQKYHTAYNYLKQK